MLNDSCISLINEYTRVTGRFHSIDAKLELFRDISSPGVLSLTRSDARFSFNFVGEANFRGERVLREPDELVCAQIGKRNERNTIRELDSRCARK